MAYDAQHPKVVLSAGSSLFRGDCALLSNEYGSYYYWWYSIPTGRYHAPMRVR